MVTFVTFASFEVVCALYFSLDPHSSFASAPMAATAFLAAPFHAPGAAPRAEAAGAAGPAGPPAAGGAVGWRTDGAWGLAARQCGGRPEL